MITGAELRKKIKTGKPSIGTWLQLPSPDVAEIISRGGYDWAAVDMEHGAFTRSDLPGIFRSLELGGTLPFARLLESTPAQIKQALDSGAKGIILPMISSGQQLAEAIDSAFYPLPGSSFSRGVGFSRGNNYGEDIAAYLGTDAEKAEDIVIVAQIENIKAIDALEDIFSNPRLDAYMVGPYDLSASMGIAGTFTHPDFIAALDQISKCGATFSVPKGIHVVNPDPEELNSKIASGYTFLAYGIDAIFLQNNCKAPV